MHHLTKTICTILFSNIHWSEIVIEKKYATKLAYCTYLKFGYSEKATKFEKNFHVKFDITE